MSFDQRKYSVEEWLTLEEDGLLQKVCNFYDDDNNLIAQYKTRVGQQPSGSLSIDGKFEIIDAPALFRSFSYDGNGNAVASVPQIGEWTQECEDEAVGSVPDSLPPAGETPSNPQLDCCDDGKIEQDVAVGTVSAVKALQKEGTSGVAHGEPDTFENATVVGVSRNAGNDGEDIKYQYFGTYYDSFLNFPDGDVLFLGTNGTITNIEPTTGFSTRIGTSLGPGAMYINIESPIEL